MALTPLAQSADVAARLRRALTTAEADGVDDLVEEASVKVLAHIGKGEDYFATVDIPTTVKIVTSRMVARVFEQAPAGVIPGTQQAGKTTGPFSTQTTFINGASSGGPWLTRSDRADLDNAMGANKVFGVDTLASSSIHAEWCALNFGALYCSCGVDIAGSIIFGTE